MLAQQNSRSVRKLWYPPDKSHARQFSALLGNRMTWEALAAVGELLGAIGVIASLVYLAGQVRSSGYQSRQAAIQSVVNKMNDVWNTMAAASTADLWTRGSKGLENLSGW